MLLVLLFGITACREDVNESPAPRNVFETLWRILDAKYCFFDEKQVNWDSIYDAYAPRIDSVTSSEALFLVLGEMICELKDGHVNLVSPDDMVRYWKWFEDYDSNFSEILENNYLGYDYRISSGMKYKMLNDSIGYLVYRNFSAPISDAGLDAIFTYFERCPGIIVDVRNNAGGTLSNVDKMVSRFIEEKRIFGYIRHKTGSGHRDFSDPYPMYEYPASGKRYSKKVVVLTNRMCYSATNTFVSFMRQLPNVTVMGDKTGGGGGLPLNSVLPNGWLVRLSSCPIYDADMVLTENGVAPDYNVMLMDSDAMLGFDTIIESACLFIRKSE